MSGKLADVYGRRLVFVAGFGVFGVASLAAALAPSIGFLIGAQVLQGVGAAMVEPTVLALIKARIPRERLGLAFGVQGIAAGLGAALGPTLGGVITTALSWEFIFYLNVPVAILAIAGAMVVIPESRESGAKRRLDLPGLLSSGGGLFALVFAIVQGPRLGWGSPAIVDAVATGIVLLVRFVLVELRVGVLPGPARHRRRGCWRNGSTHHPAARSAMSPPPGPAWPLACRTPRSRRNRIR